MDLSIVIPAYNESHKIARDIAAASAFLVENKLTGEIIIADDGSPDGTAEAAGPVVVPQGVELKVLKLEHRGKGSAVRQGITASRGDFVLFADSGVCVPFSDALQPIELIRNGQADIVNGSRKMASSRIERGQTFWRRVLSAFFRRFTLWYLDLPRNLTDTQCGFKVYRGDVARRIYAACFSDGFSFDLEVLMRARAGGLRVAEHPVHWTSDRDSRLRPGKLMLTMLGELRALKKRMRAE